MEQERWEAVAERDRGLNDEFNRRLKERKYAQIANRNEAVYRMKSDGHELPFEADLEADCFGAALVRGRHFTEWATELESLRRAGKLDKALQLALELIGATERAQTAETEANRLRAEHRTALLGDSDPQASHPQVARETPPFYTLQAAMIYRVQGDIRAEIEIIDRWERHAGDPFNWRGATHSKLLARREAAKRLLPPDPMPSRETQSETPPDVKSEQSPADLGDPTLPVREEANSLTTDRPTSTESDPEVGQEDGHDYSAIGRLLQQAAANGNAEAQAVLGSTLAFRLEPPNLNAARRWLTLSAEQGNTTAQGSLGLLLMNLVLPPEIEEAKHWLTLAAEAGHVLSMYQLGVIATELANPPNVAEGTGWYRRAAELGMPEAQFNLGTMLIEQVPPQASEGEKWLRRAADAGLTDAQANLGLWIVRIADSEQEFDDARGLLTQAAEAGSGIAAHGLGKLLVEELDQQEEGVRWLTRAAEAGYVGAQADLGTMLALGDPGILDYASARSWLTQAAQQGHTVAQFNLATLILDHWPGESDEAISWLTQAATAGLTDAQFDLGVLLVNDPASRNLEEARRWLTAAALDGDVAAKVNLGILLSEFGPEAIEESRRWLTEAATAGDSFAQVQLGIMLLQHVAPPEPEEALRWLLASARQGVREAQYVLGMELREMGKSADGDMWLEQAALNGMSEAIEELGEG